MEEYTNFDEDFDNAVLDYQNGNKEDATKWFSDAAKHGHVASLYMLGYIAAVKGEEKEAVELWEKAAKHGHKKSLHMLGRAYEKGSGCQQNITTAVEYYRSAAEKGLKSAHRTLGNIYSNGREGIIDRDFDKAVHHLIEAVELSDRIDALLYIELYDTLKLIEEAKTQDDGLSDKFDGQVKMDNITLTLEQYGRLKNELSDAIRLYNEKARKDELSIIVNYS